MPLQFSEFTDLPLLFIILEPCHYNFTNLRTIPLHTLSLCFLNFMDKNTPDLLPLTPPSFPSLSKANPHRDELLGGAPPGRIRRARHRPPPRVRRPPGRGHPELAGCHPNNQRRGRGGALVEGGARRRRRGSCAAAKPAACPGWISPSCHGRPPGRIEGEGTQGGGAVPAAARRTARLGATVGRPPRVGPP